MNYYAALGLMLIGVFGHFVAKLSALEEEGQSPRVGAYLRTHPWRILNMLVACAILLLLFQELGQLNIVTAILTGYTCQSASDNLRKRAENRMRAVPDPNKEI
jgi:quinol-cytochrome oxidoreductase complex cytochrome b subunit